MQRRSLRGPQGPYARLCSAREPGAASSLALHVQRPARTGFQAQPSRRTRRPRERQTCCAQIGPGGTSARAHRARLQTVCSRTAAPHARAAATRRRKTQGPSGGCGPLRRGRRENWAARGSGTAACGHSAEIAPQGGGTSDDFSGSKGFKADCTWGPSPQADTRRRNRTEAGTQGSGLSRLSALALTLS